MTSILKIYISVSDIAHLAGRDAGNRQMRSAGRIDWSDADYVVATREYNRVIKSRGAAEEQGIG